MRVIPPFFIAVLMLASPVANTRIPQASERPTLELPVADPAATGPFSLRVMGAMTGAFPIVAHPVKTPTQTAVNANRRASFFMAFLSVEGPASSDASSTVTGGAHGNNASPPHVEAGRMTGSSPGLGRPWGTPHRPREIDLPRRLLTSRHSVSAPCAARLATLDAPAGIASMLTEQVGGPDMAPQTPSARKRPGDPGALLDRLTPAPRSAGYCSSITSLFFGGVVNLAEVDPPLAVELGELLLLDRVEVRRPGVDLDARQ